MQAAMSARSCSVSAAQDCTAVCKEVHRGCQRIAFILLLIASSPAEDSRGASGVAAIAMAPPLQLVPFHSASAHPPTCRLRAALLDLQPHRRLQPSIAASTTRRGDSVH